MKLVRLLPLFILFLFGGCKQDFDITAPYQEIPVVYALLNANENTHYIRIQKGFLIEGDAYAGAAQGDSIYYTDSLRVQIKTLPNGTIFNLTKFDGSLSGIPKESGVFASNANVLYKFTGNLDQNKRYRLEVTNTVSGKSISAEVDLVKDFTTVVPFKSQKISLKTVNPPNMVFYSAQNAAVYDLKVTFPYLEFDAGSNALLIDSFVEFYFYKSKFVEDIFGGNNIIDEFNGAVVLNNIKNQLVPRSDRYRTFNVAKGMKFTIYAGGVELASYINSQLAQGSSLASNEALPPYTNLNGAYGIFSSRYFKTVDSVLLSNDGLDTLACSPIMAGMRFKGSFGQICD